MSTKDDTTSTFELTPPPIDLEAERKAKRAAYEKARRKKKREWDQYKRATDPQYLEMQRQASRDWRAANPEKARELQRLYLLNNPEKRRQSEERSRLKRKYGLSPEQLAELIRSQRGRCLICNTPFNEQIRKLQSCVDHDHRPGGKVRGILCRSCNVGLGHASDNPKLLRAMARYLERAQKADEPGATG